MNGALNTAAHGRMRGGSWVWALILIAFAAGFYKAAQRPPASLFQAPAKAQAAGTISGTAQSADAAPRSRFLTPLAGPHRHAASRVELADGRLRAFWFSGSREGAADVEIRSAVFDPKQARWGEETTVIDRQTTQSALSRFIRKLGNPVPVRVADGRLHLFFVTVSVGGWAGSSITVISSSDEGKTWGPARRLITSPFINISTLVKGTPSLYADGSIGLPVYHEFLGKFGELLRLTADATLLDKQRLSHGYSSLQPVVLVRDATHAQVLMRAAGEASANRVIGTGTADAGRTWTPAEKTALRNPSAAVSGFSLPDGPLLVVANDIEANRDALSLLASGDGGKTWRTLAALEDQVPRPGGGLAEGAFVATARRFAAAGDSAMAQKDIDALAEASRQRQCAAQGCSFEFSYPYIIRSAQGDAHLVYTWNRSAIKHIEFSRAWLDLRLKEAGIAP